MGTFTAQGGVGGEDGLGAGSTEQMPTVCLTLGLVEALGLQSAAAKS